MVAPVPAQISSAPRNVRTPSTLNSFRILPVATGVGTLSPLVFQASSLPYPASSPNPRRLILLQTLLRSPKSQLLWNQANPNSLCKCAFCIPEGSAGTRGVGGVRRLRASVADPTFFIAPLFSYSYKSLFPQPLSFHIHAKPPGCHSPHSLSGILASVCPVPRRQIHSFHTLAASLVSLCNLFCARFLCFQLLAASFHKIPGVWVSRTVLRDTRGWGYA